MTQTPSINAKQLHDNNQKVHDLKSFSNAVKLKTKEKESMFLFFKKLDTGHSHGQTGKGMLK